MSDKRAILAIGGSITTVVMIIGIFSLVPTVALSSTSVQGIYGHATLTLYSGADGSVKAYIQTDNAALDQLKNCTLDVQVVGSNLAATACAPIDRMVIGDGGLLIPGNDDALSMGNEYTNTGPCINPPITAATPAVAMGLGDTASITLNCNQANMNQFVISNVDILASPVVCPDTDMDGLLECPISEVGLKAGGTIYARTVFAGQPAEAGDFGDFTYTLQVT